MNEEELIARTAEERAKIFERYERGRENLVGEIDPWEDPEIKEYQKIDRYGFIHNDVFESTSHQQLQVERERSMKWLKMLDKWDDAVKKNYPKVHRRIYKGIPSSCRMRAWCKLLNIDKIKRDNRGKYQEMLRLAKIWSPDARQIDSDVNRQFREHDFYRKRYSPKQCSLFNILCAYSIYNSEVGYCQGMSGLAGVLLMFMDEEDAFWALSVLLADKKYAMHGLYIEGFPKLTRFLNHHDRILTKFMPKLKKHFDKYGLDAILYSLKWFFVCFVERVPFSLCVRVWDTYLLDGERVVTAMAYTILKMHKKEIMRLKDMDLIVEYLQVKLHKEFGYEDDLVIYQLEKSMEELKRAKLDHPGPPPPIELPQRPFGLFIEPGKMAKIGRRAEAFTDTEKIVNSNVIMRSEAAAKEARDSSRVSASDSVSELSGNGEWTMGSRRSLAGTSVTSTADLSVFSSGRSQAPDTHSNASDDALSTSSGMCVTSTQAMTLSGLSTPRATLLRSGQVKTPLSADAADVIRIHVSYCNNVQRQIQLSISPDKSKMEPLALGVLLDDTHEKGGNRIRIQVPSEELTPVVDSGRLVPNMLYEHSTTTNAGYYEYK